jgi:glycosyltransferase involved in cell wall biosynthesis
MQISVIVPVRNEENSISDLLDGLLAQSSPPFEIVITDGGSTDKTAFIVEQYISRGAPVRLVRSGPALPGRGRNLAAREARGDWLAFIDAGVRPETDWLERLAARANSDPKTDVVYGSYEPVVDTLFKECAAIAYVPPPREIDGVSSRPRFIASALMRKSVWASVGGFPEQLRSAEDLLFMEKIDEAGYVVRYEPRAKVRWSVQPTLGRTFKRFMTYARNNIRAGLWRDWQKPIFSRYALLVMAALPAISWGYRWLAVPLVLWLLLLCARGSVSIWRNRFCFPAGLGRNVLRLLYLMPLIVVLDAAAFVGTAQWLLQDKLLLGGKAMRVNHGA